MSIQISKKPNVCELLIYGPLFTKTMTCYRRDSVVLKLLEICVIQNASTAVLPICLPNLGAIRSCSIQPLRFSDFEISYYKAPYQLMERDPA